MRIVKSMTLKLPPACAFHLERSEGSGPRSEQVSHAI